REQDVARDVRDVEDRQFGNPKTDRVEPERRRAEHPSDEQVVEVVEDYGADVDDRENAAEAQQVAQMPATQLGARTEWDLQPQRDRARGNPGDEAEHEAPSAGPAQRQRDADDPPDGHLADLADRPDAVVQMFARERV